MKKFLSIALTLAACLASCETDPGGNDDGTGGDTGQPYAVEGTLATTPEGLVKVGAVYQVDDVRREKFMEGVSLTANKFRLEFPAAPDKDLLRVMDFGGAKVSIAGVKGLKVSLCGLNAQELSIGAIYEADDEAEPTCSALYVYAERGFKVTGVDTGDAENGVRYNSVYENFELSKGWNKVYIATQVTEDDAIVVVTEKYTTKKVEGLRWIFISGAL